jgi:hypothetical protein
MLNVLVAFLVILIRRLSGKSNQPASTIIKRSLASLIETFCNHAVSFRSGDLNPLITETAGGQRAMRCPLQLKKI